jgi:hypothetical protein
MREYAKIAPTFWTGETGKRIRAKGCDATLIALYLISGPNANWLGLYYIPLPTLSHETGISPEGASKGLRSLEEIGFAYYDHAAEVVYLPEAAKYQIGESLKAGDLRIKGILKDLQQYGKSMFARIFYDRYAVPYHLPEVDFLPLKDKPLRSPFEAPSKPVTEIRAGTGAVNTTAWRNSGESSKLQPATRPIIDFPLNDKSKHQLFAADIAEFAELYPGIAIDVELRKAKGWLLANPKRRKTKKGIAKFLHGWLGKAQDRGTGQTLGRSVPGPPEPNYKEYIADDG